jgi:hypothetical protein
VAFEQYRWVVLAGGAGAGKSQLAAEWTQRAGVEGFWTTARGDADATVAALAPLLAIDETRAQEEVVEDVVRALGEFEDADTVWVVDTPESVALCVAVRDLASPGPRILFTTRDVSRGRAPSNVGWWAVELLGADDSVRLLKSRGYGGADEALEAVAEAVGHLPLALELLAGLLGDGTWTPDGLLTEFARTSSVQLGAFRLDPRTDGPRPNIERSEGVFATLTALLDALPEPVRERVAGLGYLADAPVPLDLLAAICDVERNTAEWRELVEACPATLDLPHHGRDGTHPRIDRRRRRCHAAGRRCPLRPQTYAGAAGRAAHFAADVSRRGSALSRVARSGGGGASRRR